ARREAAASPCPRPCAAHRERARTGGPPPAGLGAIAPRPAPDPAPARGHPPSSTLDPPSVAACAQRQRGIPGDNPTKSPRNPTVLWRGAGTAVPDPRPVLTSKPTA